MAGSVPTALPSAQVTTLGTAPSECQMAGVVPTALPSAQAHTSFFRRF
jgi:hypothetical protein